MNEVIAGIRARLRRECLSMAGKSRVNPPSETLARWSPDERFRRWGITRLGSITRLDRIGIPVWMCVRPNARTLAVSQGKGIDDAAAAASALMEAIEIATAERLDLPSVRATAGDLESRGRVADELVPLLRDGFEPLRRDEPCDWMPSLDLRLDREVLVPAQAVLLDDTTISRWWRSTDGLASGNMLAEAVLHALCERIERDAMALWPFTRVDDVRARCIALCPEDGEALSGLVQRIEGVGLHLRIFDVMTDVPVPCFYAVLLPLDVPFGDLQHLEVTSGSGCHPDPTTAAMRAVTEAVQSRLTKIAGARDDFDPADYRNPLSPDIALYAECVPHRPMPCARPELLDPIETALAGLERAGITDIRLVVLADEPGLAVVKVILPQLENLPGPRKAAGGPRLARRIMGLT